MAAVTANLRNAAVSFFPPPPSFFSLLFLFSFFDPAYCKILIDGRLFEVLPRGGYFTLGELEKLGNDE